MFKQMKIRFYLVLGLMFTLYGSISLAHADQVFDLVVANTQGKEQALTIYKGKPLVVNFWATWCPPCVEEMPDLDALSQKHENIQFVGMAIDTQRNVQRFLEKIPVSYDLYVPGHSGVKTMKDLGNTKAGLPYTLVIDAAGHIRHRLLGQINKQELDQLLNQL